MADYNEAFHFSSVPAKVEFDSVSALSYNRTKSSTADLAFRFA